MSWSYALILQKVAACFVSVRLGDAIQGELTLGSCKGSNMFDMQSSNYSSNDSFISTLVRCFRSL